MVLLVVVVAALYWAKMVFVPVALCIFLAFMLNPLVRRLERLGLKRTLSVVLVVLVVAGMLVGLTWFVASEFASLALDLPRYSGNIKAKVRMLRELGGGTAAQRLEELITELGKELKPD